MGSDHFVYGKQAGHIPFLIHLEPSHFSISGYNAQNRNGPSNKKLITRLHRDDDLDTSISPPNNEESASPISETGSKCDRADLAEKKVRVRGLQVQADVFQQDSISTMWCDSNNLMLNDPVLPVGGVLLNQLVIISMR